MFDLLTEDFERHGAQLRILPLERLTDLQKDLAAFQNQEVLNGFQKYITGELYQFEPPKTGFAIRSILIVASPVPAYANVVFEWQGRKVTSVSLARSWLGQKAAPAAARQYLNQVLKPAGFHVRPVPRLPLKRLAACSGLARYGRNNLCYVEGMGSFLTLTAFFSDLPCQADPWQEIRVMDLCSNCMACFNNCPTGAIRKDRFLIDNERCLSYFNEAPGDFPEWLPESAHHCLYDCLRCQLICPHNQTRCADVTGPVAFDEAETGLLSAGKPLREFPPELCRKVRFLGMDPWLSAIPRNMAMLFKNSGSL